MLDHRVLSRPCEIHWAGWKTDSYTLERRGWTLSAIQSVDTLRMRLAMHHIDTGIRMIAQGQEFDFMQHHDRQRVGVEAPLPVFTVLDTSIGTMMRVINGDGDNFADFNPISARPLYTSQAIKDLDDYKIFATHQTMGIIVDPNDVDSLMSRIMKLNQPELAQVRENNRRRERAAGHVLHAQILTLAA